MEIISTLNIWRIIKSTLSRIDPRLVNHGERVAFMLWRTLQRQGTYTDSQLSQLAMVCLVHDIGAYKTDEINRMVQFETTEIWEHSVYGALFLARLSPIPQYADALLYHHAGSTRLLNAPISPENRYIAQLIHYVDRIDVLCMSGAFENLPTMPKELVALFKDADKHYSIMESLDDGSYSAQLEEFIGAREISEQRKRGYLEFISHSIDFRSPHMVAHTITAMAFACEIGMVMDCPESEVHQLYYGMLLHDLGKISTPVEILEKPGRLTPEEMEIMKLHVVFSNDILTGIVDDTIRYIAVRHHERINGTGYPLGLKREELTTLQCICAVADVLSALVLKRSYKDEFTSEEIKAIILSMAQREHICPIVAAVVLENYDSLYFHATGNSTLLIQLYHSMQQEYQDILTDIQGGGSPFVEPSQPLELFDIMTV